MKCCSAATSRYWEGFLFEASMLLCKEKDNNIVELTLPKDANIYASEYSLYLPHKTLLQQKLAEWTQEYEGVQRALEAAEAFSGETGDI